MIDGVCGGVAEYFALDPTLVRIATVLLALFGGAGIVLYIVAMIIMPVNPHPGAGTTDTNRKQARNNEKFWGILLVGVGLMWLVSNLGLSLWNHWWGLSWDVVLPVLLILAGVAFLFGGRNYVSSPTVQAGSAETRQEGESVKPEAAAVPIRRLYRSRQDRKIFGVCGGLGEYFSVDTTIVRLLVVVSAFVSFGMTLLMYILMAIIVPKERLALNVP